VSSATDEKVKDKPGAAGKSEPKAKRPNPVALEVPVSVAGARPASAQDKRELFTEDTTTVLVFKDGAVIQLSAAITVGQLLFLTDKRSKREVVCQVVHKRNFRPTSCYVELEFTEPADNFWGVSFPEHEETEQRPPTAEAVEAEDTTEDDRSEPVTAPKTEDVTQLKKEVEALRAQLRELQQKQTAEEKKPDEDRDTQARRLAEAEAAARAAAESEAKERAERIEREARERAARLVEEARQKLQAQQARNVQPSEVNQPAQDETSRRLAEAEAAARAAAETEARQKGSWATDEESKKASEEARKWELESIENERKRKQDEQERREREQAEGENPPAAPEQVKEVPAAAPPPAPTVPKIGMKLPSAAAFTPLETAAPVSPEGVTANQAKEEIDPLDELLPKPSLDFSRAPKGLDPNDPYNIYKPLRKKAGWVEVVVAGVLVVLLVGGGGFAWYKGWLPFAHRPPKTAGPAATKAATPARPAAVASSAVANPGTTSVPAAGNNGTAGATTGTNATPVATEHASGGSNTFASPKSEATAPAVAEEKAPEKKAAEAKASGKKESAAKAGGAKSGKNHGKAETSSESTPKPAESVVPADAPVLPAKLLHAVQPIYPPDAMRNYITGDVRIEAVVDAAGHIGDFKILVGPPALRQAAIDALKQYEYAPATQGGKAVASKVVVTVKFWFDP
jgi:TonB family protein